MTDNEKLTPERAVRLLRAKGAELENRARVWMDESAPRQEGDRMIGIISADIALIAQLLADHIEAQEARWAKLVTLLQITTKPWPSDQPPPTSWPVENQPGANDINIPATHKMPSRGFETGGQPWGPDHPDYDEMGQ